MKCNVCSNEMLPLFSSFYCKNDCDKKIASAENKNCYTFYIKGRAGELIDCYYARSDIDHIRKHLIKIGYKNSAIYSVYIVDDTEKWSFNDGWTYYNRIKLLKEII